MTGDDLLDLDGQVALVTGAGQGAGRGIALELARHNAGGIAVNDFHAGRADEVAAEIRAMGMPAMAIPFDVCDLDAVRAANTAIAAKLGPVTILVNNAGMAGPSDQLRPSMPFWEESPAEWGKYLGTNLYGVFNCCHAIMPGMVAAKRGRIVTIVSDAGRVGEPRQAIYGAAKAGAAGFMRSIAKDGGRYGITANSIALSGMLPPGALSDPEAYEATDDAKTRLSRYTIRRFGKAEDVAALTTFLCSNAASWITGQTYPLNGGYSVAL